MWLWLQRRLPKSVTFLGRLLLFCATLHFAALFVMFFIYKGDESGFNFQVSRDLLNSDAPVVFLPLYKRIPQQNPVGKKSRGTAAEKAEAAQEKKENKTIAEEQLHKTTLVDQAALKRKQAKKLALEKKKAQEKAKKLALEKQKALQKKAEEKAKAEEKKQEIKAELDEQITTTAVQQNIDATDDVRYVGRMDLDALQMQEFISKELGAHWNPPVGVPEDTECDIRVVISWEGKLMKMEFAKASGVRIYDSSARASVQKMTYPKWLWGKEFTITFKQ